MSTGNITLTFETPDQSLVGSGSFDISETFKALFTNNPAIHEEISNKITQIFEHINASDIGKNWTDQIKKSLNLTSTTIDLKDEIKNTLKDTFKGFNFGGISTDTPNEKQVNLTTRYLKIFEGTPFTNFLKAWNPVNTEKFLKVFNAQSSDFLKNLTQAAPTTDTVFEDKQEVVLDSFSDKAIMQLHKLFGKGANIGLGKIDSENIKPEQGFFSKLMSNLLPMLGLGAIPAILRGLTGGALLAGILLWLAFDGIRGWLKSDEWGVSKISAAIGAALGGLDKGETGAWKNSIKGAWLGGLIGSIGGPIGLIVGALVGAAVGGILGWIGGEELAKDIDSVSANIAKWYKKNINAYINEGIIAKMAHVSGTLSLGPEAEDSTREMRHGFFNALILQPMKKWINNFSLKSITSVAGMFGVDNKVIEGMSIFGAKGIMAAGGKAIVGKTIKLGLSRILKFIPGVSAIIGTAEALDYFRQGNIPSGLLALASGIAGVFPGIGTGISILLDVVNAGLTGTKTGKAMIGNMNQSWDKLIEFLKYVPGIGSLIYFSEGLGLLVSGGDTSQALLKIATGLAQLIPGTGSLVAFFEKKISNKLVNSPTKSLSDILSDTILTQFENYPEWMKFILKQLGVPIVSRDLLSGDSQSAFKKGQKNLYDNRENLFKEKTENERFDLVKKLYDAYGMNLTEQTLSDMHITNKKYKDRIAIKNTQAAIVSPTNITFQPANEDHLYQMGQTDIYAKKDDILGKTFININKQLTNLVNAVNSSTKVLNEHTKVLNEHTKLFVNILNINQNQLSMLPSLVPQPQQKDTVFPSTDMRDPAYEYRGKLYNNMRGI